MRQRLTLVLLLLAGLCGHAVADDVAPEPALPADAPPSGDEAAADVEAAEHDYSRFSDGPRNVPTPRGRPKRLADRLGLGGREAGSRLITRAPEARWTAAAGGRRPRRLLWPVRGGTFGRGFGHTRQERRDLPHLGIDISARPGTPVRAAADGIVAYSDNGLRGYGNCVILVHSNGWATLYAHLRKATVQPGQKVTRGTNLGEVGQTGIARGPHLHFELRDEGRGRDPLPLLYQAPANVMRMQRPPRRERATSPNRRAPPARQRSRQSNARRAR